MQGSWCEHCGTVRRSTCTSGSCCPPVRDPTAAGGRLAVDGANVKLRSPNTTPVRMQELRASLSRDRSAREPADDPGSDIGHRTARKSPSTLHAMPEIPGEREIGRELTLRWSRRPQRMAWWGAGWPRSGGSIRRLCKLLLQSGGSVLMAFFLVVKLREKSQDVLFGLLRLGSGGFDLRLCHGHKRRQPFRELGSGLTFASHKKRTVEQDTIQKW